MKISEFKVSKSVYGSHAELDKEIIIRDNKSFQISIIPTLSTNDEVPHENLSFILEISRKSNSGSKKVLNINSLKGGEIFRMKLNREDVSKLFSSIESLKELMVEHGLPSFESSYIQISDFDFFNGSPRGPSVDRIKRFFEDHMDSNPEIFDLFDNYKDKLGMIKNIKDIVSLQELIENSKIDEISSDDIETILKLMHTDQLKTADNKINVVRLKKVISELENNFNSNDESLFQDFFEENSFVFPFIVPTFIHYIKDARYLGGKKTDNKGGKNTDFIFAEGMSNNISIIEIKTPQTKLMNETKYRDDIYTPASDLTGAIVQGKIQKDTLLKDFYQTTFKGPLEGYKNIIDPDVYIIAGLTNDIGKHRASSFEAYRKSLKDVKIITYDEMLTRLKYILANLEA